MAIKEIKLNAQNFDTMKKFAMVQGDSARVLRCYVDLDLSTVTEARIYIKKADGTEIYNDCIVTGQYVDVPLTTQALAVVGDQVAQLHLKDGNGYITTYKFILQVLKSYVSGSAIESSNEFTALENALTEVEEFGAKNLVYDNEESGLEASNIQDAIDELANNPSGVYVGDEPPAKATTWVDTSEDVGGGTFVDLYKMEVNKVPIEGLNTNDKTVEGAINEVATDYIVEQGTSGIWAYRKWNSGIAECWLKAPLQKTVSAYSLMGGYYATITDVKLPTNLFNATPTLDSVMGAIANGVGFGCGIAGGTTNTSISIWGNQTGTTATIRYIKAIGTWK